MKSAVSWIERLSLCNQGNNDVEWQTTCLSFFSVNSDLILLRYQVTNNRYCAVSVPSVLMWLWCDSLTECGLIIVSREVGVCLCLWGIVHFLLCPYPTTNSLRGRSLFGIDRQFRISVSFLNSRRQSWLGADFPVSVQAMHNKVVFDCRYMPLFCHNGQSALQVCFSFTHYHTPSGLPTRSNLVQCFAQGHADRRSRQRWH